MFPGATSCSALAHKGSLFPERPRSLHRSRVSASKEPDSAEPETALQTSLRLPGLSVPLPQTAPAKLASAASEARSRVPPALLELDMGDSTPVGASAATLERWAAAYHEVGCPAEGSLVCNFPGSTVMPWSPATCP